MQCSPCLICKQFLERLSYLGIGVSSLFEKRWLNQTCCVDYKTTMVTSREVNVNTNICERLEWSFMVQSAKVWSKSSSWYYLSFFFHISKQRAKYTILFVIKNINRTFLHGLWNGTRKHQICTFLHEWLATSSKNWSLRVQFFFFFFLFQERAAIQRNGLHTKQISQWRAAHQVPILKIKCKKTVLLNICCKHKVFLTWVFFSL